MFRAKIDYRMLGLTYTYSLFRSERFEAGLGLGLHILEMSAEGGEPGTLRRERDSEAGVFPTIALNGAYRISKRWAVTARGQSFSYADDEEGFDGALSDYHIDLQYRWRKNFAIGLGYTEIDIDLEVTEADQPFLFQMNTSGPELFFRASF